MVLKRNSPHAWSDELQFNFCVGPSNYSRLTFNPNAGTLTLSRAKSGSGPLDTTDALAQATWVQDRIASLPPALIYNVTIVFDVSVVEIIVNGTVYMSSLIFPPENAYGMNVTHVGNGGTYLTYFKLSC
ncbi:GH32 C-terminal domain-containing protein [Neokomagataea anthophila]|uniref:GH32 C-terminal domain-containing protein n=1 Tax=Neokomagataea anthophila TaxID=2826925 RepID=A0ABS5E7Z3_9PROT|nr:GH32 C-terminal domain-containing protein [Neokomagataea anthophila]MBR0560023.1 GH32 C-terminal domain-containing protein [Neokomagataea anthophila]